MHAPQSDHSSALLLLALLALLIVPNFLYATDVSGPVSGTWTLSGSPYNVVRRIVIPENQTLTIEPGVQVIFQGWYALTVWGQISAVGTPQNPIVFTSADTTLGWNGIRFQNTDTQLDSSLLVYCRLSYGRSSGVNGQTNAKNGGVIFCLNSRKLRISHCVLSNNRTAHITGIQGQTGYPGTAGESVTTGAGGAIYLDNSSICISENFFSGNQTGNAHGGMGGSGTSNSGSYASGRNGGPGGYATSGNGGAIFSISSSPEITKNQLINNFTGDVWGGKGGTGGNATVTYNNGTAHGGEGGLAGLAQSGNGGAIFLCNGSPILKYNIFRGNRSGNSYGGEGGHGGNAGISGNITPYNTTGGNGGNGNTGRAGFGGGIYLGGAVICQTSNNLFYDYNRTGFGRGGNGGEGGAGYMYGSYYSNFGGDGGDGSDGYGGNGGLIYIYSGNLSLETATASLNLTGFGYRGLGGYEGFAAQNGEDGSPGAGFDGIGLINNQSPSTAWIVNSIIWNNGGIQFQGQIRANYSCVQGGLPGMGNIAINPLFVNPYQGDFHLQSSNASYHNGQWLPDPQHSPCIDAGDPLALYSNEPPPNGGRINMGFEGNTIEASLSATDVLLAISQETAPQFSLHQNYPNPFNPTTTIRFTLSASSPVTLEVFDVTGRCVSGSGTTPTTMQSGTHEITFDGSKLASGIYIYRLTAGEFTETQKMTLLK